MNSLTAIENFDSSVLLEAEGNPIFGEDNEIIGWEEIDLEGGEPMDESADWDLDERYQDPAEDDWEASEPDESWFDEDALNSIGWGVDEAY